MHELSIAVSLVDIALAEAERCRGNVVAVHVRLGPLSGVEIDALQSAYRSACDNSPLAGSRLIVHEVPVIAWCEACGMEREIGSIQRLACPVCGMPTPDVRGGRELEVTGLEVLDGPADENR